MRSPSEGIAGKGLSRHVPGLGALNLGGHIGNSVSALVDGQLSREAEEQVWQHVLGCPGCRRLVEREGWTKTRLGLSGPREFEAPPSLIGALYHVEAWAEVDQLERTSRRRRAVVAMVGAGSIGAAVFGMVALTSPPVGGGELPGPPSPAMIRSEIGGSGLGAGTGAELGARPGAGADPVGRHASR